MAYLDDSQRALAIQLTYVGPPGAGKSRVFQRLETQLLRRKRTPLFLLKEQFGAEEHGFEWIQFEGSPENGISVFFQLLSIPATPELLGLAHNERLAQSDAVIFLCDSQAGAAAAARPLLETLRRLPPLSEGAPLLVQAHKQDLPGALAPKALGGALGLAAEIPVLPSSAETGEGIQEALLSAVRVVRERARRHFFGGAGPGLVVRAGPLPSPAALVGALREMAVASRPKPVLPSTDLPARYIWPPSTGRAIVQSIPAVPPEEPNREGADGKSSTALFRIGDLCLKTTPKRRFISEEDGMLALVRLARAKGSLGALLLPRTALCLQPDGAGAFWLWTVTPWVRSLQEQLKAAESARDEAALGEALSFFAKAALLSLRLAAQDGISLDLHPSNFCVVEGTLRYVDDEIEASREVLSIGYSLLRRVEEYAAFPGALEVYLRVLDQALGADLGPAESSRAALSEALGQTAVASPAGRAAREQLSRRLLRRPNPQPR